MNSIVLAHNDETDVHQSEYLYHFAITALPLEQTSRCMYKNRINKYIWDSTRKIYFLLKRKRKYKSQNKSDSTGSPTYHAYAERNLCYYSRCLLQCGAQQATPLAALQI